MDNLFVASESLAATHAFLQMRSVMLDLAGHPAAPTQTVPAITVALKTMNVIVGILPPAIVQQEVVEIAAGIGAVRDTTD